MPLALARAWFSFAVLLASASTPALAAESVHGASGERWEVLGHANYTHQWTASIAPYGVGIGLSLERTFAIPVHLAVTGLWYQGSRASAFGPEGRLPFLEAQYQQGEVQLGVGFEAHVGSRLSLRPGVVAGLGLVFGHTSVSGRREDDLALQFTAGLQFAALFSVGTFVFGVEGDARVLPNRIAAPLGTLGIMWGARF